MAFEWQDCRASRPVVCGGDGDPLSRGGVQKLSVIARTLSEAKWTKQSKTKAVDKEYFVYIMTNWSNKVLYTGVTGRLSERIAEHKEKKIAGFTNRYNVTKLVYFESFPEPESAIAREKQIKAGSRQKKIELINGMNPEWKDLFDGLYV